MNCQSICRLRFGDVIRFTHFLVLLKSASDQSLQFYYQLQISSLTSNPTLLKVKTSRQPQQTYYQPRHSTKHKLKIHYHPVFTLTLGRKHVFSVIQKWISITTATHRYFQRASILPHSIIITQLN